MKLLLCAIMLSVLPLCGSDAEWKVQAEGNARANLLRQPRVCWRDPNPLPARVYNRQQQSVIMCANQLRKEANPERWENAKSAVRNGVLYHGIHPDDFSRTYPFLCEAASKEDTQFVRFLLAHQANPNTIFDAPTQSKVVCHAHIVQNAIAFIAHGADIRSASTLGQTALHMIRYDDENPAQLALLYFLAGADPTAADNCGKTALMRVVCDLVAGTIGSNDGEKFEKCKKLAAMLVKIGVPTDVQLHNGDERSSLVLYAGDDIWKILRECRLQAPEGRLGSDIGIMQHIMQSVQSEVTQVAKAFSERRKRNVDDALALVSVSPPGIIDLIVGYAHEHMLPPSVLPDLRRLRLAIELFKKRYAAEKTKDLQKECVVS